MFSGNNPDKNIISLTKISATYRYKNKNATFF